MEVHAHTHTARKKWTHYFWEFLMLFLAVTLGFFVENQREHFIENQRAKKFAVSLVEDLQGDTAEIHLNKKWSKYFFQFSDLVLAELKKSRSLQNDTILQLEGTMKLFDMNLFDSQMGNFEQIKNSGSLRYFERTLISKLTSYESYKNRLVFQKQEYQNFLTNIVTPFIIKTHNADFTKTTGKKEVYQKQPVFITALDKATLNEWKNIIIMSRLRQEIHKKSIEFHEKMALELIDELKRSYHLQ